MSEKKKKSTYIHVYMKAAHKACFLAKKAFFIMPELLTKYCSHMSFLIFFFFTFHLFICWITVSFS